MSSRDLELVIGWRNSGLPPQDVCRGIDVAVDTLRDTPRDLYAVRRFVEPRLNEAVHVHLAPKRSAEQHDPWQVALDTAKLAQQNAARPEVSASFLEVSRRLRDARDAGADPWTVMFDLDQFVVRDLFARLSEDERRLIDLEIEGQHGAHLSMMNEEAREQTLLESRRRALEQRWQIPSLTQ